MARRKHTMMSALSVGVATVMLAGCGGGAGASGGASTHPSQAASPQARISHRLSVDERACAGVQAVIGHLAADTAHWSPQLDPFDKTVSRRIRLRSAELDKQAPRAGVPVQRAVHATARAFTKVAQAMRSRNRPTLTRAIGGSRTAYRELKRACR